MICAGRLFTLASFRAEMLEHVAYDPHDGSIALLEP